MTFTSVVKLVAAKTYLTITLQNRARKPMLKARVALSSKNIITRERKKEHEHETFP